MAGNLKKFNGGMAKTSWESKDKSHGSFMSTPHCVKIIIYWQIILILLGSCYATKGPDVEGEALVDLLKCLNDTNKRITDWSTFLVSPCDMWSHVTCRNNHVVSLSLGSIGFTGTLSPSITKLKSLVSLDLQDNYLTGPLPDYLGDMANLQYLNLAKNSFNGSLPSSWGQLLNLKNLILSGNHLTGSIPDSIGNILGLNQLDVSSNALTGRIPVKLFTVPSFNFTGTKLNCGSSPDKPCVSSTRFRASTSKSKLGAILTSVGLSAMFLLLAGIIFAFKYFRHNKVKGEVFFDVAGEDDYKVYFSQLRSFSWRELQLATDNFSESNVIGQGGFGKVYLGVLSDNTKIAVKRLTDYCSPGGEAAFKREVEFISVAVHKNLLRLIGFCATTTEKMLVYPFMQNLSVAYRLRDLKPGEKGLDWPARKRVAFGAAQGLEYLHEHCNPKIIHRDLKAANILLDDNFEPVLGDFGLAKLVDARITHVTTQIRGTMGHIAPEYLSTGKSSEKTDVFGYGITLLELVTGQRAIDFSRLDEEEDVLLLDHIKKLQRENRLEDIVDRNLNTYDINQVETIIKVALLCTQGLPEDRPNMAEVVKLLEGEGLAERWGEWEQLEEVNSEVSLMSRQFAWADDLTQDQEAIQLSEAR